MLYLFILLPMARMIWRSLLDGAGQCVGLANYARYFGTPAIAVSITNSLFVVAVSMVLTVGLAFGYAYALTRTRMPAKGSSAWWPCCRIFAPSLVQAFAFVYVFGNNGIFTRATGWNVGIYGPKGIVFAEVFYCFPTRCSHPHRGALRHRRPPLRCGPHAGRLARPRPSSPSPCPA